MAIHFNCPHCKKPFKVDDRFAGRPAPCPSCKKTLTIPTASVRANPVQRPTLQASPRPEDIEALAASAFHDEPPAQEPENSTTIAFECPFCSERVKVSSALAGKQAPCPECRRIVKVPLLVKKGPADWRTHAPQGPTLARRDEPQAPAGAWGSATTTTTVSEDALIEAEALPDDVVPLTVGQKATRIAVAAGVLLTLGAGWMFMRHSTVQNQEQRTLKQALRYLQDAGKPPTAEAAAEVHRAAGEFHLRESKPQKALDQFRQARGQIAALKNAADRDPLLVDLALLQIELGGDKPQVIDGTHLKWDEMENELRRTLLLVQVPDVRCEALRQVTHRLNEKNQALRAVTLCRQLNYGDDKPEALAIVALELFQAGQTENADKVAQEITVTGKQAAPSLVALWLALDKPDKLKPFGVAPRDPKDTDPDTSIRIGYAEGWARQGKPADAQQLALASRVAAMKLRCLTAVAGAALDAKKTDAAESALKEAVAIVKNDQGRGAPSWILWRLVGVGVRAGQADLVQPVADLIPEPNLKGRAQFEVLRERLRTPGVKAELRLAEAIDKKTFAHALALETVLRAQARTSSNPVKSIAAWDEPLRPFGYIGVALGLQDGE